MAALTNKAHSLVFIVNAANPRARITSEAAIVLSQHGTVAPVTVHQRTDFAAAMIDGRTVMEIDRADRSCDEIVRLWAYLDGRLNGNSQATLMPSSFADLPGVLSQPARHKVPLTASSPHAAASPPVSEPVYQGYAAAAQENGATATVELQPPSWSRIP